MSGELGILLGGFREREAIQLRVDLDGLHAAIIPSLVEMPLHRRRLTVIEASWVRRGSIVLQNATALIAGKRARQPTRLPVAPSTGLGRVHERSQGADRKRNISGMSCCP